MRKVRKGHVGNMEVGPKSCESKKGAHWVYGSGTKIIIKLRKGHTGNMEVGPKP